MEIAQSEAGPATGERKENKPEMSVGTIFWQPRLDDESRDPVMTEGQTSPKWDSGLPKKECEFAVEVCGDRKHNCSHHTADVYRHAS